MTGQCLRCGACCSVLPLLIKGMSPDYLKYLRTRGLKEDQGFILIPHVCQHLKFIEGNGPCGCGDRDLSFLEEWGMAECAIHNSPDRPQCCQKYRGQRIINNMRIYRPPGCGYREEGP